MSIFSSPLLRYARYLPNICNAQAYLPQLLLLTPTTQPPTYQTMSPPPSTHTGDVTVSHPCHTAVRLLHKENVTLCNVSDPLSHSVQKWCAKHLPCILRLPQANFTPKLQSRRQKKRHKNTDYLHWHISGWYCAANNGQNNINTNSKVSPNSCHSHHHFIVLLLCLLR